MTATDATTTVRALPTQRPWLLLRAPSVTFSQSTADAGEEQRYREAAAAALQRREHVAALLEACAVSRSSKNFAPLPIDFRKAVPALHGTSSDGGAALRYQWRRDGVDLPGADQDHLVLPAASLSDDGGSYSVLVSDGVACSVVRKPAVVATLLAAGDPPWRWADLATQLRGQPDLLATVFATFRGRCTRG